MDFVQFVSMLETKSLYFTRLDLLDDPHEGSFDWLNVDKRDEGDKRELMEERKHMAVNCWHCNEIESMAMWQLYARKCYGIAIKSTFDDLCKAIGSSEEIYIGKVEYWDEEPSGFEKKFYSCGVLRKRRCYDYEKEVRAVVHNRSLFWDKPTIWSFLDEEKQGVNIPVNLSALVKEVCICPDSMEWFNDLVSGVIKKYAMNFKVRPSTLLKPPSC